MSSNDLQRIGFFHFGARDRSDPLDSLREALKAAARRDLANSLIVLPEAFNLNGSYFTGPRPIHQFVRDELNSVGGEFGVAFVAGMLEPGEASVRKSTAVLIDTTSGEQPILSKKMGDDNSKQYAPATFEEDIPAVCRNLAIAGLVCMDAFALKPSGESNAPRHERLPFALRDLRAPVQVLAIPGIIAAATGPEAVAITWAKRVHTIIANGHDRYPSIVHFCGRSAKEPVTYELASNKVCVVRLPSA